MRRQPGTGAAEEGGEEVPPREERRVVLALLELGDLPPLGGLDLGGFEAGRGHHLGHELEGEGEVLRQGVRAHHRSVAVGAGVDPPTHLFDRPADIARLSLPRTAEQEGRAERGQSFLPRGVAMGAGLRDEEEAHQGKIAAGGGVDAQAVGEGVRLDGGKMDGTQDQASSGMTVTTERFDAWKSVPATRWRSSFVTAS